MSYRTEQEEFWAGEFGSNYISRNGDDFYVAANVALFSRILNNTRGVNSVVEFGANVGLNLQAIKKVMPHVDMSAVEINKDAVRCLKEISIGVDVHHASILDFSGSEKWDLCLVKGVLIHIDPEHLPSVYSKMYASSARYICLAEYYSPTPVEVSYRGHSKRLFKRDFAGELMASYPDLKLIDYGFVYRRDPNFPQDDITWFLLEKS